MCQTLESLQKTHIYLKVLVIFMFNIMDEEIVIPDGPFNMLGVIASVQNQE